MGTRAAWMTTVCVTVSLCVQFSAWPGPYGFGTVQLTNDDLDDTNPEVNIWGDVAWEKDTDVFLWWNQASDLRRLQNNNWPDARPMINDSRWVTWYGAGRNGSNQVIYRYKPGGLTQALMDPPTYETHWNPKINNRGEIAWFGSPSQEIWLADSSLNLTRITNNSLEDNYAVINNAGQIAWMRRTTSINYEIYLYTPGGSPVNISNRLLNDTMPSINDLGQVAWERGGSICIYDPDAGITELTRGVSCFAPVINNLGQVIWKEWDAAGGDWDIYLYDTDLAVHKLADSGDTNSAFSGPSFSLSQSGAAVWQGWDGQDYELYYWDTAYRTVYQVTNNDYDDDRPRIDGTWIAWSAAVGGGDREIMRANIPEPGTCGLVLLGGLVVFLKRRRHG